jgi:hypothetical protein
LVLDFQTTDVTNLKQVREGAIKFVRDQVTDADVVGILSVTNNLRMLQPFTQDKAKLIATLEDLSASPDSKNSEQKEIAENISGLRDFLSGADTTAAITSPAGGSAAARVMIARNVLQQFIRMRTMLSLQQARPVLAALAALAEGLPADSGQEDGGAVFTRVRYARRARLASTDHDRYREPSQRCDLHHRLGRAARRCAGFGRARSRFATRGVSGIANQEQRIRAQGGETVFDTVRQEGQNREYDILYRISGDTGGKFLKGNNDIGQNLERINQEIQARYTLSYRSTNQNFDGAFRKVKIEVRRPDTEVMARSGYYAIPPDEIVLLSPADKKLLAWFC